MCLKISTHESVVQFYTLGVYLRRSLVPGIGDLRFAGFIFVSVTWGGCHSCRRSRVCVSICLTPKWIPVDSLPNGLIISSDNVVHQNHHRVNMCSLNQSGNCEIMTNVASLFRSFFIGGASCWWSLSLSLWGSLCRTHFGSSLIIRRSIRIQPD